MQAEEPGAGASAGHLLSVKQVADILGLRARDVVAYARRGELPSQLIGNAYMFIPTGVERFTREVPEWVLRDTDVPFVPEKRMDFSGGPPSKAEEAVTRLRQWIVDAAAKKPRDPLGPDPDVPKRVAERARGDDGRFTGPRVNVDKVPRLPTFPARWALEDPRRRPYHVFWRSSDGGQAPALKLTVGERGETVVLTMPTGMIYRLGIRRRPLPRGTGTALFYLCPSMRRTPAQLVPLGPDGRRSGRLLRPPVPAVRQALVPLAGAVHPDPSA